MPYKCITPRHIKVESTHVGPLQYALELCICSALIVILAFPLFISKSQTYSQTQAHNSVSRKLVL
jgi:hypothetical protein